MSPSRDRLRPLSCGRQLRPRGGRPRPRRRAARRQPGPFGTVYVLKDDLKGPWSHRSVKDARAAWESWFQRALESRIAPLVAFARKLEKYLSGILAHAIWPLHTSRLEGINNKIKVIKRMAYGFRDDEYFFLKIRAAFPGNPG